MRMLSDDELAMLLDKKIFHTISEVADGLSSKDRPTTSMWSSSEVALMWQKP